MNNSFKKLLSELFTTKFTFSKENRDSFSIFNMKDETRFEYKKDRI